MEFGRLPAVAAHPAFEEEGNNSNKAIQIKLIFKTAFLLSFGFLVPGRELYELRHVEKTFGLSLPEKNKPFKQ